MLLWWWRGRDRECDVIGFCMQQSGGVVGREGNVGSVGCDCWGIDRMYVVRLNHNWIKGVNVGDPLGLGVPMDDVVGTSPTWLN
jgi:hypothetical protein